MPDTLPNGSGVLILVEDPNAAGTYLTVGSQRESSLDENVEPVDASSKDAPERAVEYGRYSATISLESIYVPSDSAFQAFESAQRNRNKVVLRRSEDGTNIEDFTAIVGALSRSFPDQGEATVSATFEVDGAPSAV